MSYEKVSQDINVIIGAKQTLKALLNDDVYEIIIAKDAQYHAIYKVEDLAKAKNIPISYVDSMKKLGKTCGIDVGAATVALKK